MAMSISESNTCPDACVFKLKGCYAKYGNTRIHWNRLDNGESGMTWDNFLANLKKLRKGSFFRHNVAGDLPGENQKIDKSKLSELTEATKGKVAWTYTHKPVLKGQALPSVIKNNIEAIKIANENGFTVNLSGNNLEHADQLVKLKIGPVVVVLPSGQKKNSITPDGNRIVVCPATTHENVSCYDCGLCQRAKREYIIGFPAHGSAKKTVNEMIKAA